MSDSEYAATADWVRTARTDETVGDRLESIARGRELEVLSAIEPDIRDAYVPGLEFVAMLIRRAIYDIEPAQLPWRPLLHRAVALRSDLPEGLHSMVLTITTHMASGLDVEDVNAAQRIIARGLFGRSDIQDDALAALEAIEAETDFTFPVGESPWAQLVNIGRPQAQQDRRAVDMLLGRSVDRNQLRGLFPRSRSAWRSLCGVVLPARFRSGTERWDRTSNADDPVSAEWVRTARHDIATDRLESIPRGSEVATLAQVESGISEAYVPGLELVAVLMRRVINEVEPVQLPWRPLLHRAVELPGVLHDELRSMMLTITADVASELEAVDIEAAQQIIARGLLGRVDIQNDALAALEAIEAETDFTFPVGESPWARLITIGRPLAEADIRALDILLGRSADGT